MNTTTQSTNLTASTGFLQAPGEMARRTREYDWSSTSLGAIAGWPSGLKTTVGAMVRSKFPMLIMWGEELIQFYNDAFRPSLGNDGKHPTALGQRGKDCWAEIWPVISPLLEQVTNGGESIWSEDQLIPIYRNGRLEDVYWTFCYSGIPDEQGMIAGVLVMCYENTEKMVHYQQVMESESQLSFAIDAAELGTWDYDPLNGTFSSNDRLKSWFGLAPAEVIELGQAIEAMIPADRARVAAAIQEALEYTSGGYYDIAYTIVNKITGQERIVRAKGRAWFNEDKIAYRFNGTLQDITDQEMARIRLQEAEQKAWLAIGTANLGTYEIDLETEQITASDRFNAIWGLPPTEDGKKPVTHIHPNDRAMRIKAHQESLVTGHLHYEIRVFWPDRTIHWVRIQGKVLYDAQGHPVTLLGVIHDITEQKQFAEELSKLVRERTVELERSNDDLLHFAHVISHDLKEPVRKIKVYSGRIQEEFADSLPDRVQSYLMRVQSATKRMSEMIEGVLNYSSVSASDETVEMVDLNQTFQHIEDDLEILIQQKGARIVRDTLPSIEGAPVLLHQLFYNIVNNSLKFSKPSVPSVVNVSCVVPEEGVVQISITDNGIGFDPEHKERIFQTFTRLHSKDVFEGTGLGLNLSKKITERHGGVINAIGRPGEGATLIVTLPMKVPNQPL